MSDFDRNELFEFITKTERRRLAKELVKRALQPEPPDNATPSNASWEKGRLACITFLLTQLYGRPKTAANPKPKEEEPSMLREISTEKLKTLLNED